MGLNKLCILSAHTSGMMEKFRLSHFENDILSFWPLRLPERNSEASLRHCTSFNLVYMGSPVSFNGNKGSKGKKWPPYFTIPGPRTNVGFTLAFRNVDSDKTLFFGQMGTEPISHMKFFNREYVRLGREWFCLYPYSAQICEVYIRKKLFSLNDFRINS